MEEIVNKVANSGLITIDLKDWSPSGKRASLDLAPLLFQGLVLREKEFRDFVKEHDWAQYQDAYVNVYCSAEAIIPQWAFMLISAKLVGSAKEVVYGTNDELEAELILKAIEEKEVKDFIDERVIIKGCSGKVVGEKAYLAIAQKLTPHVKSLMFGEACSSVPIYKKK